MPRIKFYDVRFGPGVKYYSVHTHVYSLGADHQLNPELSKIMLHCCQLVDLFIIGIKVIITIIIKFILGTYHIVRKSQGALQERKWYLHSIVPYNYKILNRTRNAVENKIKVGSPYKNCRIHL